VSKKLSVYENFSVDIKEMKKNKSDASKLIFGESAADFRAKTANQILNSGTYVNQMRMDSYITSGGILIDNCNPEYAKKFDEVSVSFKKAVSNSENVLENDVLEQMASKYETLRNKILENYSDDDLNEQLNQLDNAYEEITRLNIASPVESNLWKAQSREDARAMFEEMRANCAKEKGQAFADMAFGSVRYEGKNTVFDRTLYNKVFTMSENIMKLADRARQYIKDGNHAPVTEDEKSAFNEYISNGTDGTIGNLSYYDIKSVLSVVDNVQKLDSEWLSDKDNYNNILNSFNNSSFSDEVKNLLSNVLNQTSWNNYEPKDEQEKIEAEIIDLIEKRETDSYERKNSSEVLTDEKKYKRYIDDVRSNNVINEKMEALFNLE